MSAIDNKRIAKNTLFLYIRMIVVMGVGLYTVRAILHQLGVVDYGIYNVVGGIVSMFSFINGTLATSSQRYFSIELAKKDYKRLNQWFCLNITVFSLFILVFIIVAETIGLWFVNYKMTIPEERIFAANVVYQLSIVSFCIHFFNVPYNALIIAHERMSAFAYISIIEAFLKLGVVYLLTIANWDKLIVYSILMCLLSCGITSSYIIYNRKHFKESKFHPYWNKTEFLELFGFSGWHFFGTFSMVIRSQGINILLNLFFNPAINAARAIAYQIYHAISQLSNNFFMAVKPQIYKSYANKEFEELYKLIMRSTLMCSFLVSILVFPILANTSFILNLWLKEVPEYAIIFTQLVLVNGLVDATNGPTFAAALATGKIRRFYEIVATLFFLNLPISYVALKLGAEPYVTMIVSICVSFITSLVRAYLLRSMIGLPFCRYLILFIKLTLSTILIWFILNITTNNIFIANSFVSFIIISSIAVLLVMVSYIVIMGKEDRKAVYKLLTKKVKL